MTISPVRHLRDGMIENGLSKALLRSAVHQLMEEDRRIQYFPSYEIMMDDLRDYRFYQDDLLHPSMMAIQYIQKYVSEYLLAPALQEREEYCKKLSKRLSHRPQRKGIEWERFLSATARDLKQCMEKFPNLSWLEEQEKLQQLSQL